MTPTCPACHDTKEPATYLCAKCWYQLTNHARRHLRRKDGTPAARRLGELLTQIKAGVPLGEIVISR